MPEAPAIAWYLRYAGRRSEIEAAGVRPRPEFDGDSVCLFSDRGLALAWAASLAAQFTPAAGGTVDVWEVRLGGLVAERFPHIVDDADVYVTGVIDAERMPVVETV